MNGMCVRRAEGWTLPVWRTRYVVPHRLDRRFRQRPVRSFLHRPAPLAHDAVDARDQLRNNRGEHRVLRGLSVVSRGLSVGRQQVRVVQHERDDLAGCIE